MSAALNFSTRATVGASVGEQKSRFRQTPVSCNKVQTPPARATFVSRFGLVIRSSFSVFMKVAVWASVLMGDSIIISIKWTREAFIRASSNALSVRSCLNADAPQFREISHAS